MEVKEKAFYIPLKRYWGRRSYQRLDHNKANRSRKIKNVKLTKSRSISRRFWRIKPVPKLRSRIGSSAMQKLWNKFKAAYMQMMVSFSGRMWYSGNERVMGDQKAIRQVSSSTNVSCGDEFESRLVYEIYKAILESRQLSSMMI